ncbi:MAG: hypothetical protein PHS54_00635 [Clostridia bacterium]|nr:hypothetical protein [Clostridia bacterium]
MSDRNLKDMSVFEQSRWYALMEAVNLIADECEERHINFNKIKISPLDIEKYIEGTCDIFARKIIEDQKTHQHNGFLFELHNISSTADKVTI